MQSKEPLADRQLLHLAGRSAPQPPRVVHQLAQADAPGPAHRRAQHSPPRNGREPLCRVPSHGRPDLPHLGEWALLGTAAGARARLLALLAVASRATNSLPRLYTMNRDGLSSRRSRSIAACPKAATRACATSTRSPSSTRTAWRHSGSCVSSFASSVRLNRVLTSRNSGKLQSETLKYLFLLYSEKDVIPLQDYTLNTEAHPLPRFQPTVVV